jgi:hypothetical protein
MKVKKVYIFRNTIKGWGIVEDSKHIDTGKALFFEELEQTKHFCDINKLEVIRICR